MKFTYAELFAGIGGFHLGLEAVGGKKVFANERDKYAAQTYAGWFGSENLVVCDIKDIDKRIIPKHDLLCAGFPCQPFSIAGVSKKNSLGRNHGFKDKEQGNLFFEIMKIVVSHSPKIVFLENVKNLTSHDGGRTWKVIQDSLDKAGYEVRHKVIDASGWVPQRRNRVFIVALSRKHFNKETIKQFAFPEPIRSGPKLKKILHRNLTNTKFMLSDALWAYLQKYSENHKRKGNGFGYKIVNRESVSPTMSARYYKDGAEILIQEPGWRNPRRLTPREAARLMGFNSKFAKRHGFKRDFPIIVSDVQAYKQFGNAVCPQVVESIAEEIVRILNIQDLRDKSKTSSSFKKVS